MNGVVRTNFCDRIRRVLSSCLNRFSWLNIEGEPFSERVVWPHSRSLYSALLLAFYFQGTLPVLLARVQTLACDKNYYGGNSA